MTVNKADDPKNIVEPKCEYRLGTSPTDRCSLPQGHEGKHKIRITGNEPEPAKPPQRKKTYPVNQQSLAAAEEPKAHSTARSRLFGWAMKAIGVAIGAVGLYATLDSLRWLPISAEIEPNGPPLRDAADLAFALPFQVANRSRTFGLGEVTFQCMLDQAEFDGASVGRAYLSAETINIGPSETVQFRCPIDRMLGRRELRSATVGISVSYNAPWPWPDRVTGMFTWDSVLGQWLEGPVGL